MTGRARNCSQRPRGGRQVCAELGIEGVLALKQKGERALRSFRAQAAFDERGRVVADRLGGAEHPLGRRLAHAVARVEHAVDGGDAHVGGPREIGDGRATAQVRAPGLVKVLQYWSRA